MEKIDPAKAAAVWQRVHNSTPQIPREQGLTALIQDALISSSLYEQLARQSSGDRSARLRQLARQEAAHAACLKGIFWMLTGKRPTVQIPKSAPEKPEAALRRCCGRTMRCIAQYEARSADPEFGAAFAALARQAREDYVQLLIVLGNR